MIFHIRLFLSFILTVIVSVNCFNDLEEDEDTGADDALRQALVLVEMLRSEYMKVLRENKDLAAAIAMVKTASPTEHKDNTRTHSTLADKLVSSKTTQLGNGGGGDNGGGAVRVSASPIPRADTLTSSLPPKTSTNNFARHYKNLFGSGPSRRFMKQPSGSGPSRRFMKQSSGKILNKMKFRRNMPQYGTTIGSLKTKDDSKSSTKKAATMFKTSYGRVKKTKKTTKQDLDDKHKTKDPLVAQVASEILNEIQGSNPKNVNFLRSKIQEVLKEKKNHSETVKHKTSLKIHLGLSSRMPLPLPENNAFCFYVPESPLCGSG